MIVIPTVQKTWVSCVKKRKKKHTCNNHCLWLEKHCFCKVPHGKITTPCTWNLWHQQLHCSRLDDSHQSIFSLQLNIVWEIDMFQGMPQLPPKWNGKGEDILHFSANPETQRNREEPHRLFSCIRAIRHLEHSAFQHMQDRKHKKHSGKGFCSITKHELPNTRDFNSIKEKK